MKHVYEEVEGWWQFQIMPANTTHIAYFYENGSVYLPEDGVSYTDFHNAVRDGNAYKLIRADQLPEVPTTVVSCFEVYETIMIALHKHEQMIIPAKAPKEN